MLVWLSILLSAACVAVTHQLGVQQHFFAMPSPTDNQTICPPAHIHPYNRSLFNLTDFTGHPWYVQQQMLVIYQQESDLFCTRDLYRLIKPRTGK
jgi:hypothetical protein